MDAAIASMKECRKEFAALLSKSVRSAATKARNAQKRKEKAEAKASGIPLPPKERTSAWQAFSAGDEVHGIHSAVEAYPEQYATWLAEQKDAKQALTRFAKFARTADFGKGDYAKLEERFANRKSAASSESGASSAKKSRKLSDEQKAANKAARAAKKAAEKAAAAPPPKATPAKAKAPAAPAAPAAPKKAAEKAFSLSSSSSSPPPKKKLLVEEEEKPKGKGKGKGKGKAAPPPSDDEEEKPKPKQKPKGKAAPPPSDDEEPKPKPKAKGKAKEDEEDDVGLKPYKLKGKDVLRTADNYLFEKAADGDFGDYIGLLGEDGEVDAEAPNPFDVDE